MSFYDDIGQHPLPVNSPFKGLIIKDTGVAIGTADAVQFENAALIYSFDFQTNDATPPTVDFYRMWKAHNTSGSEHIYKATDATALFYPLSLPIATNESLVCVCTSTAGTRQLVVTAGRYSNDAFCQLPSAIIKNGTYQGASGGGGAAAVSYEAHTLDGGTPPTPVASDGLTVQPVASTNQIPYISIADPNGKMTPHDSLMNALRGLVVNSWHDDYTVPVTVVDNSNLTAGTTRYIMPMAAFRTLSVQVYSSDISVALYWSNDPDAGTASTSGWIPDPDFGTMNNIADIYFPSFAPLKVNQAMIEYIATDTSNAVSIFAAKGN